MALSKLFTGNFPRSQKFGNKLIIKGVNIYKQYGLDGHNGIDYACPTNTPLLAALDGTVFVNNQGKKGYGLNVKIIKNRKDGISEIIYGHLSSTPLMTGALVKAGDIIGYSGGAASSPVSGTSTGAHLHFGLRFHSVNGDILNANNGYNGWIDPTPFFE